MLRGVLFNLYYRLNSESTIDICEDAAEHQIFPISSDLQQTTSLGLNATVSSTSICNIAPADLSPPRLRPRINIKPAERLSY